MAVAGTGFFLAQASWAASAQTLRLSTWNMDWLLDEQAQNAPGVPTDIPHRNTQDFTKLAAYATRLRPDLIGLQEVGNSATLARLFPRSEYQIFVSHDDIPQHTALAARQGLHIQRNPDVTALALETRPEHHPLRSGLDITLQLGSRDLRVLVVHFKTGCWDNPLSEIHHACPVLFQQFQALQNWISDRAQNEEAFAILGDFNRRLTRTDPLFTGLNHITPLTLVTSGQASPCQNGSFFIDHILLGGAAAQWLQPDSLRVMIIPQNSARTLSDHCPVSVTLRIPQP